METSKKRLDRALNALPTPKDIAFVEEMLLLMDKGERTAEELVLAAYLAGQMAAGAQINPVTDADLTA